MLFSLVQSTQGISTSLELSPSVDDTSGEDADELVNWLFLGEVELLVCTWEEGFLLEVEARLAR